MGIQQLAKASSRQLCSSFIESLIPGASSLKQAFHTVGGASSPVLSGPATEAAGSRSTTPVSSLRFLSSATAAVAEPDQQDLPPLLLDIPSAQLRRHDVGAYYPFQTSLVPEALRDFHQSLYAPRPKGRQRLGGCIGLQAEISATQQPSLMYRPCIHELKEAVQSGSAPRLYLQGPSGAGKSVALVALVEWARQQGWLVMYIPSAVALTRGGYFLRRGDSNTWDTIISAQHILKSVYDSHKEELGKLPRQTGSKKGTVLDLVVEGLSTGDNAAKAVDSCLGLKAELIAAASTSSPKQQQQRVLFAIDDYNALYSSTDYGTAVHRLARRQLRVEELTLASGLRLLQDHSTGGAQVVAAETTSWGISPRTRVPRAQAVDYHVARLSEAEVANALSYYHSRGVAPTPPSAEQVRTILAMSNGNFEEVRRLACKSTAYELGVY